MQHTAVGDLLLSNQFDSLVGMSDSGTIMPMAAKSWAMNDDFTVFVFKIDTSKRFSDGSNLKAQDFKDSWETSLSRVPLSANNSLLDVFYKVHGFSKFQSKGTIDGIQVINNETLQITFDTPFRMALDHLTGNRFSVFKIKDQRFIGTGPYAINELDKDQLLLTVNPYQNKRLT